VRLLDQLMGVRGSATNCATVQDADDVERRLTVKSAGLSATWRLRPSTTSPPPFAPAGCVTHVQALARGELPAGLVAEWLRLLHIPPHEND
jgi:hypothetical protein